MLIVHYPQHNWYGHSGNVSDADKFVFNLYCVRKANLNSRCWLSDFNWGVLTAVVNPVFISFPLKIHHWTTLIYRLLNSISCWRKKRKGGGESSIVSCPKHGVAEIFPLLSVPPGCQNTFYCLLSLTTWSLHLQHIAKGNAYIRAAKTLLKVINPDDSNCKNTGKLSTFDVA